MDTKCAHFWVIEAANGPASQGICQYCNTSKSFKNYITPSMGIRTPGTYSWGKTPRVLRNSDG